MKSLFSLVCVFFIGNNYSQLPSAKDLEKFPNVGIDFKVDSLSFTRLYEDGEDGFEDETGYLDVSIEDLLHAEISGITETFNSEPSEVRYYSIGKFQRGNTTILYVLKERYSVNQYAATMVDVNQYVNAYIYDGNELIGEETMFYTNTAYGDYELTTPIEKYEVKSQFYLGIDDLIHCRSVAERIEYTRKEFEFQYYIDQVIRHSEEVSIFKISNEGKLVNLSN